MRKAAIVLALLLVGFVGQGSASELPPDTYLPVVQRLPTPLRGVGATYAIHEGYERCAAMRELGLGWYYNWDANAGLCTGIESVPWIWCDQIPNALVGSSPWAGFGNEPDIHKQCNRSPATMADVWIGALAKFPGKRWVAPNSYSIEWADDWLRILTQRQVALPDALGIHCYEQQGAMGYCEGHWQRAIDLAAKYGIGEVWITEYAYVPTAGEPSTKVVTAMNRWLAYVESRPEITRHAWFQLSYAGSESWAFGVDRNTSLVHFATGELTPYGLAYRLDPVLWADPRADVNGDKFVDILDLSLVGGSFGRAVK